VKLRTSERLRQHPEDPNVWEYPVNYIRTVFPRTPCRGCPKRDECRSELAEELDCEENTVWYGEHIEVANKLEGKV
jgi:hypothetical protein